MSAEISVVIPTHDRPQGLARLIDGLRAQTIGSDRFEVIVVDDGSSQPAVVSGAGLHLRVIRHPRPRGPAAARNSGWRAATAPVVAFVDDDCLAAPQWLGAILAAAGGERAVVQGRVAPAPEQVQQISPLSHTIVVEGVTPLFISANIAYPRSLLERLGGFDESFLKACGEDAELGARALAAGAAPVYAESALVFHEVRELGVLDQVRHTLKWTDGVRALAMHPELRSLLIGRIFWKPTHPWLLGALGLGLARRPRLAGVAIVPYLWHYLSLYKGPSVQMARAMPTHLVIDLAEIATAGAASMRYRTLML